MYSCIAVEGCRGLYSCRASAGGLSKGEGVVEDCRGVNADDVRRSDDSMGDDAVTPELGLAGSW